MFGCECAPKTIFTCVWMMNKNVLYAVILSPLYDSFSLIYQWAVLLYIHLLFLNCDRGVLKPGQPPAPVVKFNNLIPPNVATSLSSYMSHNIIGAIFSYLSQSLNDRFYIANRENMCPLTLLACAKNRTYQHSHFHDSWSDLKMSFYEQ